MDELTFQADDASRAADDRPAVVTPSRAAGQGADALSRQRALVALGRRALVVPEVSILLQDAAALLAEMLQADYGVTARLAADGRSLTLRMATPNAGAAGPQENTQEAPAAGDASLWGHVLQVAQPVVVSDLSRERRFADPLLAGHGVTSAVAVPLMLDGQSLGALGACSEHRREFDDEDVLFVEAVAYLVATTIARANAEQSFDQQRRLAGGLLETVDALVLVVDAHGRIVQANPACERITGFSAAELEDRFLWDVFAIPDEVEKLRGALEDSRRRSAPTRLESRLLAKDGRRLCVEWSCALMIAADEDHQSVIATGVDITRQRNAEEQADRATQAAEEARAAVARLQAAGKASAGAGPLNKERRQRQRRSYPYTQKVAFIVDGRLPEPDEFLEIQCNDIAAGGFSFLSRHAAVSDTVVVALGVAPNVSYLTAQVAHVTRVTQDGHRMFSIGCNYTGRAEY